MNDTSSAARNRRAMRLGIVVIVGILTTSKGLPVYRSLLAESDAEMLTQRARLEQAQALIGQAAADSVQSVATTRELSLRESGLFQAASLASASANLSNLVADAAADAGVSAGPMQVSPDTSATRAITRISVSGNVKGDIRRIAEFLNALAESPKLVRVRELTISAPDFQASGGVPTQLDVFLVIDALALVTRTAS